MNKKNLILMYMMSCLQGMVFYGPIATLYRQAAGINILQITIIESISLLLCVFLELPWGIVADKIGYKKTLIICCLIDFVSKIVFWRANGFGGFLLERVLLSIVIAGFSGVDASMIYLSSKEEDSQKNFGIYCNLGTIGLLIAAGVYSLFVGENYRLAGFMTMISYGIMALLSFGLTEVKSEEKQENQIQEFVNMLKELLHNKQMIFLLIAIALLNETHQTITVFLNQLQYVRCGLSTRAIGIVYIIVTVLGLLGGLSDKLTKFFGEKRFGKMLFVGCIVSSGVMVVTKSALLSVGAVILLRVSFSLFQPLQMELQNRVITSNNRATALSINALFMDFVAIVTNLCFGKIADVHLPLALGFGTGLCIIGLLLYTMWFHMKE